MTTASDRADDAASDKAASDRAAANAKAKPKGPLFHVVKPFTFAYAGTPQVRDPVTGKITAHAEAGYERSFVVGDNQEMTPEMVDHPWILSGADGSIETDEQHEARIKAEKAAIKQPSTVLPAPASSDTTLAASQRK